MSKTLFTIAVYLAFGYLQANNISDSNDLLRKLTCVNAEWIKQPEAKRLTTATQITGNTTYNQWIATHLMLVEQTLRNRDVDGLSLQQKQNRENLLNELHGYWQAGTFPTNDYLSYKNPVFIDRRGTHCAVGYLMMQSGHDDLARNIDRNEKFAYVHQIKTGGVKEWADAYGFTIDELAWIQPSYMPTTKFAEISDSPNGPINILTRYSSQLLVAGNFDSLGNTPCLNIGFYNNGVMNCIGDGVDGKIVAINYRNNYATVAGALQAGGQTYPLAYFAGLWNYVDIPGREGAIATYSLATYGDYKYEIAISHPAQPGVQEIWFEKNNGDWECRAIVYGVILDMKGGGFNHIYAGAFDSITFFNATDTNTIIAHNVIINEGNSTNNSWYGIGAELSDTVRVIKSIGNSIYFGGYCSRDPGKSNICLTRYLNGALQPLLYNNSWPIAPNNINAIEEYNNRLLLGGQFQYESMTRCKNLMLYDVVGAYGGGFGYLDSNVNALISYDGEMFLGGSFTNYSYLNPLQYLAKIDATTALNTFSGEGYLQIYPNPTQSTITFSTGDNEKLLQTVVSDLTGREIIRQNGTEVSNSISVEHLPPGIYILKALTQNGTGSARFVKN